MLEYFRVQCVPANGAERARTGGLHREQIPSEPCPASGDEAVEYTQEREGQRAGRPIHLIQGPATRRQEETGPVLPDHLQILRR